MIPNPSQESPLHMNQQLSQFQFVPTASNPYENCPPPANHNFPSAAPWSQNAVWTLSTHRDTFR